MKSSSQEGKRKKTDYAERRNQQEVLQNVIRIISCYRSSGVHGWNGIWRKSGFKRILLRHSVLRGRSSC